MQKYVTALCFVFCFFLSTANAHDLSLKEKERIFKEVQDAFLKQNIKLDKNKIIQNNIYDISSQLKGFR